MLNQDMLRAVIGADLLDGNGDIGTMTQVVSGNETAEQDGRLLDDYQQLAPPTTSQGSVVVRSAEQFAEVTRRQPVSRAQLRAFIATEHQR